MFIQESQQTITIKDIMKMLYYYDNISIYNT